MLPKLPVVLISGILLCAGCHSQPEPVFRSDSVTTSLPEAQNRVAAGIIQDYLALKDALVEVKAASADSSARRLQAGIQQLQAAGNGGLSPHLAIALDSMALQAGRVAAHPDKSCESQRICFKYLSDQVIVFIRETGARGIALYSQYCPMALNETGGWWLSTSDRVRNPYFGSKMLTCGEVVDTFR